MSIVLPDPLIAKASRFPESSFGANRVTLVLADGSRVPNVTLAWGREIVKVDLRPVFRPEDLGFPVAAIIDVLGGIEPSTAHRPKA